MPGRSGSPKHAHSRRAGHASIHSSTGPRAEEAEEAAEAEEAEEADEEEEAEEEEETEEVLAREGVGGSTAAQSGVYQI